jgi:hypothetical protein
MKGKRIFSIGTWLVIYFSDELKTIQKDDYKLTLINGYDLTKIYMFIIYVEHFYNKKKNSLATIKFIAKCI